MEAKSQSSKRLRHALSLHEILTQSPKIKARLLGFIVRFRLNKDRPRFRNKVIEASRYLKSDRIAMIELKNRASENSLKLEEIFRIADTHHRDKIPFEEFKKTLVENKILLRPFTVKELELLLSDPKTQEISYTAYIETLIAFGLL